GSNTFSYDGYSYRSCRGPTINVLLPQTSSSPQLSIVVFGKDRYTPPTEYSNITLGAVGYPSIATFTPPPPPTYQWHVTGPGDFSEVDFSANPTFQAGQRGLYAANVTVTGAYGTFTATTQFVVNGVAPTN